MKLSRRDERGNPFEIAQLRRRRDPVCADHLPRFPL
jgi:hypothetical protein